MPDCFRPVPSSLLSLPCLWLHLGRGLGGVTESKRASLGRSSSFLFFFKRSFALASNLTLLHHSDALSSITELTATYV